MSLKGKRNNKQVIRSRKAPFIFVKVDNRIACAFHCFSVFHIKKVSYYNTKSKTKKKKIQLR